MSSSDRFLDLSRGQPQAAVLRGLRRFRGHPFERVGRYDLDRAGRPARRDFGRFVPATQGVPTGPGQVVLAEDYDDPDRVLGTGREVDEKEERLRTRSLIHTRLILGMALVGTVVYAMLAAQFGLWRPDAPEEWGTSFLSCMWLVVATPTIVAGWLEKGTYGRSYSSWED